MRKILILCVILTFLSCTMDMKKTKDYIKKEEKIVLMYYRSKVVNPTSRRGNYTRIPKKYAKLAKTFLNIFKKKYPSKTITLSEKNYDLEKIKIKTKQGAIKSNLIFFINVNSSFDRRRRRRHKLGTMNSDTMYRRDTYKLIIMVTLKFIKKLPNGKIEESDNFLLSSKEGRHSHPTSAYGQFHGLFKDILNDVKKNSNKFFVNLASEK